MSDMFEKRKRRHGGMTLIELMIAMLIGTILVSGAITIFVQSRANYRTTDAVARLQENARYTLDLVEPDIRLAGFWGLTADGSTVQNTAGVQMSCAGTDVATATEFATRFTRPVEVADNATVAGIVPCALDNPHGNADVLVLRHASARAMPAEAGQAQLRGGLSEVQLFAGGIQPAGFEDPNRDLVVNVYYISTQSDLAANPDEDLPSLRRLSLARGGADGPVFVDQEIMPGVENLQVQLGVDTDGDRLVDQYVDQPAAGNDVLAVRLWVLMRSETSEAGFEDNRSYPSPDPDVGTIAPGADGYPQDSRRIAVSKTISLKNLEG